MQTKAKPNVLYLNRFILILRQEDGITSPVLFFPSYSQLMREDKHFLSLITHYALIPLLHWSTTWQTIISEWFLGNHSTND